MLAKDCIERNFQYSLFFVFNINDPFLAKSNDIQIYIFKIKSVIPSFSIHFNLST